MPLERSILANDPDSLDEALAMLSDLEYVGADVERADSDRYFRAAALIQVGGEGLVALVDPIELADLSPLEDFLADRVTVLHALENDLGPMASSGVVPGAIEDTAIAAAVLGLPTGLETLLKELLGVELTSDKARMQRAPWEKRPLTEEMLHYAAADVADLPELWEELEARLEEAGRIGWYEQELDAMVEQPAVEERRDWLRTKGIGRLDAVTRARVRHLWEVREALAKETNTAPGRIASDKILVDLAAKPPAAKSELGRRGVRRQAVREFGDALMRALQESVEPERSRGDRQRPPTDADRNLAETLRSLRAARAEELGLDAGFLCPSRTLMGAVLADPRSPAELRDALELRPWQWEQVAEPFCDAFGFGPDGEGPSKPNERHGGART